jgi:hypothetical protein
MGLRAGYGRYGKDENGAPAENQTKAVLPIASRNLGSTLYSRILHSAKLKK